MAEGWMRAASVSLGVDLCVVSLRCKNSNNVFSSPSTSHVDPRSLLSDDRLSSVKPRERSQDGDSGRKKLLTSAILGITQLIRASIGHPTKDPTIYSIVTPKTNTNGLILLKLNYEWLPN